MTDKFDTSRRDFVAAAVTMAAAAGAASGARAQTQPPSNLRFSNPPGMSKPPSYSHVVEVNGPHRTVYLAGQTGVDANGKVAEGIRAQTMQVLENVKTALAFAGGGFEHVVKITSYLVDLERDGAAFREVRASYFPSDDPSILKTPVFAPLGRPRRKRKAHPLAPLTLVPSSDMMTPAR